jgi:hypothetical protein
MCPSSSINAFKHSMSFVALDGTFTMPKFQQTLHFAVSLDAGNERVI